MIVKLDDERLKKKLSEIAAEDTAGRSVEMTVDQRTKRTASVSSQSELFHSERSQSELSQSKLSEIDSASVWHAMAQHKPFFQQPPSPPKCINKASGCVVTDSQGRSYFDGVLGLWCVNVGYGRQELADVAYEQMLNLAYSWQ